MDGATIDGDNVDDGAINDYGTVVKSVATDDDAS